MHCYYKYMGLPDPIALPSSGSGSGGWGQGGASSSTSSSSWVEHSGELEGWGTRSTGGVGSGNQHANGYVAGRPVSGERTESSAGEPTQGGEADGETVKLRHSASRCNDSSSSCGAGEGAAGGGSEEELLVLPDTVEGCAEVLRDFLISASAKDCSLMLAISPAPPCVQEGTSGGSTGSLVCKWSGRTFLYKVSWILCVSFCAIYPLLIFVWFLLYQNAWQVMMAVAYILQVCLIDLDIKRLDKVPKYYKLDQDIVRHYLKTIP